MHLYFKNKFSILLFLISTLLNLTSLYSVSPSAIDITSYNLAIKVDVEEKSIHGSNEIRYRVVKKKDYIVLHLHKNLFIDSIIHENKKVGFTRHSNVIKIHLPTSTCKEKLTIYYHGRPQIAKHAPWDGGFVWTNDSLGNPWVAVACEGEGGSLWWPCKEDPKDEPDSVKIAVTCASHLTAVCNGTLEKINTSENLSTYHWAIHYPINNYNVTLNIGKYAHFADTLKGTHSALALDYYVLNYNLDKAKQHFKQVEKILRCFENYFGPYPFIKDGYALVETPYWGMEHQSAIAYGNNYENNLGPFDFIIAHETAHEWWGNSLTAAQMGELWIHEAFATYAESLLLEYYQGKQAAIDYLENQKKKIYNQHPLVRPDNDFQPDDTDIYYKGSWMLHTIRSLIDNDAKWFSIIKELACKYQYQIINTNDVVHFICKRSGKHLKPVFDQYLYQRSIPKLQYGFYYKNKELVIKFKWSDVASNFKMPVWIDVAGKKIKLNCGDKMNELVLGEYTENVVRILTNLEYIRLELIKFINY